MGQPPYAAQGPSVEVCFLSLIVQRSRISEDEVRARHEAGGRA